MSSQKGRNLSYWSNSKDSDVNDFVILNLTGIEIPIDYKILMTFLFEHFISVGFSKCSRIAHCSCVEVVSLALPI